MNNQPGGSPKPLKEQLKEAMVLVVILVVVAIGFVGYFYFSFDPRSAGEQVRYEFKSTCPAVATWRVELSDVPAGGNNVARRQQNFSPPGLKHAPNSAQRVHAVMVKGLEKNCRVDVRIYKGDKTLATKSDQSAYPFASVDYLGR